MDEYPNGCWIVPLGILSILMMAAMRAIWNWFMY